MESHNAPPTKKLNSQQWTVENELQFLSIWETRVAELRQCKRNSHIYAKMAEEMGKFTTQDVHTKITNLIRYRSENKEIGPSGGSPSRWVHFQHVHRINRSHASHNNTSLETFT